MKTILLTNDDGILSPGIQHLKDRLSEQYNIYVVAPDRERSGVSMALTINHPLRVTQVREKEFAIDGTPADCVNIALHELMPQWPDFVISGMNAGENLCEDVYFSGTVAGAFIGHMYGIPSMAVSLVAGTGERKEPFNYEIGAQCTAMILEKLLPIHNTSVVYNLNIPPGFQIENPVAVTYPGLKRYKPTTVKRIDPRGRNYFWIGTGEPSTNDENGTDLHAIKEGKASLSVLKYNLLDSNEIKRLSQVFNEKSLLT